MFIRGGIVLWLTTVIGGCGLVSAQTCNARAAAVDNFKTEIERDNKAIQGLGFRDDTAVFDSLVNASTDQRNKMAKTAYDNLISAALDKIGQSSGEALESRVMLPNGYASLNPVNVNAAISRLENPDGPMAWVLRQAASTSRKAAKFTLLKQLPGAVAKEEAVFDLEFGDASTAPRSLEGYLKLTRAMTDLMDFPVASKVLEIGMSGANVVVAYANLYYGRAALTQLNRMETSKAEALARLDATIRGHVQALQSAKNQLNDCLRTNKPKLTTSVDAGKKARYDECIKNALSLWHPDSPYCVSACKPNSWAGPQGCKQCKERPDTSYCDAWLK